MNDRPSTIPTSISPCYWYKIKREVQPHGVDYGPDRYIVESKIQTASEPLHARAGIVPIDSELEKQEPLDTSVAPAEDMSKRPPVRLPFVLCLFCISLHASRLIACNTSHCMYHVSFLLILYFINFFIFFLPFTMSLTLLFNHNLTCRNHRLVLMGTLCGQH